MRSFTLINLLAFVVHAHAKDSMEKTVDNLVVELYNRALKASNLHRTDVDDMTAGKPSCVSAPHQASSSSLIHRLHPHPSQGYAAVPRAGLPSQIHRDAQTPGKRQMLHWDRSRAFATSAWQPCVSSLSPVVVHAAWYDEMALSKAAVHDCAFDPITGELEGGNIPDDVGVYAVLNDKSKVQYIGLSKAIRKSLQNHAKNIGRKYAPMSMASVKYQDMTGKSKEELTGLWKVWMNEYVQSGESIPPGNLPESSPNHDPRWSGKAGPPPRPSLRLVEQGIDSNEDALKVIGGTVAKYPVVLFMKGTPAMPQCGFSARTIDMLRQTGVDVETVNVLDDSSNPFVRDAVKEYSNWPTIPQLFAKGELVGGCDIITQMFETGDLKKTLEEAVSGSSKGEVGSTAGTSEGKIAPGKVELINDASRPTATKLSELIKGNFQLHTLQITDESAAHEGDAGALEMGLTGESHFKVLIVSPDFQGLSPLQRQQKVFDSLGDLMQRIHAISFVTKTPSEVSQQISAT